MSEPMGNERALIQAKCHAKAHKALRKKYARELRAIYLEELSKEGITLRNQNGLRIELMELQEEVESLRAQLNSLQGGELNEGQR
jgi:hypothetical protein